MISVSVTLLTCIVAAVAQYTFEGDEQEFRTVLSASVTWGDPSKASQRGVARAIPRRLQQCRPATGQRRERLSVPGRSDLA